jgi:iron complex transport system ATP-binding protein
MTKPLTVSDLSFRYQAKGEATIFSGVTFSLGKGEIFCLIGPNGTGKSTLIKCIAGLLKAESGAIHIDGEDLNTLSPARSARIVGYVPQSHTPSFPFPVKDVVVMGRSPHLGMLSSPSDDDMRIALEAMNSVGISHLAERPCTDISGGEYQLVLIARALTQQPRILLLDELTSHLDLGNQMKILRTIKKLSTQGLSILMATHFPDHAFLLSGQVGMMMNKGISRVGSAEEIISKEIMQEAYDAEVCIMTLPGSSGRKICVPMLSSGNDPVN